MSVRVLRPGLFTTLQDLGRAGLQHLGVVPGGAMDVTALSIANALVGNSREEAALEITVLGPELVFETHALVALCGADLDAHVDGVRCPQDRPLLLARGARLAIGTATRGARAYLAVAGGFPVEPVLGSRSTYLPGRFGGFEGRALRRGDTLPLAAEIEDVSNERYRRLSRKITRGTVQTVGWRAPSLTVPDREPIVVHAMEGHHYASFDSTSQRAFFEAVWRVAPESNRMGYRLTGPVLSRTQPDEILSAPTCLGTVQVPASGLPIILMADHQTTGGYPRIAEVASADVPRLAQVAPGGTLHFARCTLEMAGELRRDAKARLEKALRALSWEHAR